MKTAEEVYNELGCNTKRDIIEAMKEYAEIVAKQALSDAAFTLESWPYENMDAFEAAKECIMWTEVTTL